MDGNLIPFPQTNGSNGSAQVRVVPYPARARLVIEHHDHILDAWDQVVSLVPRVERMPFEDSEPVIAQTSEASALLRAPTAGGASVARAGSLAP
jgi:hypothetical protein